MRATQGKRARPTPAQHRQLNIRIDLRAYEALATLAREEQRSVAQVARRLVRDALRQHLDGLMTGDDTPGRDIVALAEGGGAFGWLGAEPDLYDDAAGEPL